MPKMNRDSDNMDFGCQIISLFDIERLNFYPLWHLYSNSFVNISEL